MKKIWFILGLLIFAPLSTADEVIQGDWMLDGTPFLTDTECVNTALSMTPGSYICSKDIQITVSDIPPPPPPPSEGGVVYQDLTLGPVGSPITGWCKDGTVEKITAGTDSTLCGDPLNFTVSTGQIIQAYPPTIPNASYGDLIVLNPGSYTGTVNCGGRNAAWCGNGNSGVSIIGQPGVVVTHTIDCGTQPINDVTLANLEISNVSQAFQCMRAGKTRNNLRLVNNYVHDAHSNNSGAFGEFSSTIHLKILGNHTNNTGVVGQNNAHSIYHGGREVNDDVEIAYNLTENHEGGRCIQIFGHRSGEIMTNLYIHDNVTSNCNGNAAILISHTDGQRGTPDDRAWIDSVRVENNVCGNNQIQFRGANLYGGNDWTADGNHCSVNSTMGGDPNSWVIVTGNDGQVTGNTR